MRGFMEPRFRLMMINVFCHGSILYPGQMRAPLFLAPRLYHFRDDLSLRELSGQTQTMTGGRSEESALSVVPDYSVYAYAFLRRGFFFCPEFI